MPTMKDMRQGGTPFDAFLYALVGEDRNGNSVTVLSTLARLGLDPWDTAVDLVHMPGEKARDRLGHLLAGFGDVPALRCDHGATTLRLVALLPEHPIMRAG